MTAVPSDCATSDSHGNAGVSFTEVVTVTKKSKSQAGGSTNTKVLQSSGRNKSKAGVSITMDVRSHGHGTAPPLVTCMATLASPLLKSRLPSKKEIWRQVLVRTQIM